VFVLDTAMTVRYLPPAAPELPPGTRRLVWRAVLVLVRPSWVTLWSLWIGGSQFFVQSIRYRPHTLSFMLLSRGRITWSYRAGRVLARRDGLDLTWSVEAPRRTTTRWFREIPAEICNDEVEGCFFGDDYWSLRPIRLRAAVEVQTSRRLGEVREWWFGVVEHILHDGSMEVRVDRSLLVVRRVEFGRDDRIPVQLPRFIGWREAVRGSASRVDIRVGNSGRVLR